MAEFLREASGRGWRYKPAHYSRDLHPDARKQGRKAMDAFLLSKQVLDPVMEATRDIEDAAREETIARHVFRSGDFLTSFSSGLGELLEIAGNPRVTGRVYNDSDHAAAVEYGNSRAGSGKRILWNAAQPWNTPKRPM